MSDENGTALARPEAVILQPVVSSAKLIEAQKETHTLIAQALVKETDYGIIPGTKKPTLLKPGAERINLAFGVTAEYAVVGQEADHFVEVPWVKRKWEWGQKKGEKIWSEETGTALGLYRYVVRCDLIQRDTGRAVGHGLGSASTLESKYCDRPRELENTVLKMAEKRALVAAVLNAYALSDRFTQDMEDTVPSEGTDKADKPAPRADAPRSQPSGGGHGDGERVKFVPKRAKGSIDKGMDIADVDDADLHVYTEAIQWGADNGKAYGHPAHLRALKEEIARRENGDDGNGREMDNEFKGGLPPLDEPGPGDPPPHNDDDIPF